MENIIEVQNFNNCTDSVRTEEIIWKNLEDYHSPISSDFVFIKFAFADTINKRGIGVAQEIVNHYASHFNDKKVAFICQHIEVKNIRFPINAIVFTPHATIDDNFIPISHATKFKHKEAARPPKTIPFAFCGATYTHPCRSLLFQLFRDDPRFLLQQTYKWHFDKSAQEQAFLEENYKDILRKSAFSLCPRGTGPSTIRIWDSLAIGAVPVIIADGLKLPLAHKINWHNCAAFIGERHLTNLPLLLKKIDITAFLDYGKEIYNLYFTAPNLHLPIISHLNESH